MEKKTEQQSAKEMQPRQKMPTKLKSSHSGVCTQKAWLGLELGLGLGVGLGLGLGSGLECTQKALTTSAQMSASSRNWTIAVTYLVRGRGRGRGKGQGQG